MGAMRQKIGHGEKTEGEKEGKKERQQRTNKGGKGERRGGLKE